MNRFALSFTVKPGTEPEVARVLSSYRRPQAGAAPTAPGGAPGGGAGPMLNRTSVFMAGQRVVRVMDVNADLPDVLRHLASQPQIRAVEEALNAFVTEPRDLDDPSGQRKFIDRASLTPVLTRVTAPELLPDVPEAQRHQRRAVLYPVRFGFGREAAELLSAAPPLQVRAARGKTSLAGTTVFAREDVLVRLIEVDGSPDDAIAHLATVASRAASAARLGQLMDTAHDLTTVEGFRAFLAENLMDLISDRRVGVPA